MSVLGLGLSVCEKLTTFLLHWASSETEEGARTHVALPLNHEEIAQCVGTSRESVTRGFRELERQHLVERRGSTLLIPDLERLQQFGSGAAMRPEVVRHAQILNASRARSLPQDTFGGKHEAARREWRNCRTQ